MFFRSGVAGCRPGILHGLADQAGVGQVVSTFCGCLGVDFGAFVVGVVCTGLMWESGWYASSLSRKDVQDGLLAGLRDDERVDSGG